MSLMLAGVLYTEPRSNSRSHDRLIDGQKDAMKDMDTLVTWSIIYDYIVLVI